MAGQKNTKDPGADFLARPVLHRTTTASDAAPAPYPNLVTEILDLTLSPSASRNTILLVPIRTAGAGLISYDLWVNFPTAVAAVNTVWMLQQSTVAPVDTRTLVEFNGLFAAYYKIVVTHSVGGATFETYLSQSS